MESNAVDVYAAKERLCRDMRLLDAYAAGTPVCGIATVSYTHLTLPTKQVV